MFTGIVATTALIIDKTETTLGIENPWPNQDINLGQSIAVNGCCLTAVSIDKDRISFDLNPETLELTNLSDLHVGSSTNVERALGFGSGIDGHMVSGHIDTVARIQRMDARQDGSYECVFSLNKPSMYLVHKGSVCIDGISLTVNHIDNCEFSVMVIPHTWKVTNLSQQRIGNRVNVEFDLLGKYVENYIEQSLVPRLQAKGLQL